MQDDDEVVVEEEEKNTTREVSAGGEEDDEPLPPRNKQQHLDPKDCCVFFLENNCTKPNCNFYHESSFKLSKCENPRCNYNVVESGFCINCRRTNKHHNRQRPQKRGRSRSPRKQHYSPTHSRSHSRSFSRSRSPPFPQRQISLNRSQNDGTVTVVRKPLVVIPKQRQTAPAQQHAESTKNSKLQLSTAASTFTIASVANPAQYYDAAARAFMAAGDEAKRSVSMSFGGSFAPKQQQQQQRRKGGGGGGVYHKKGPRELRKCKMASCDEMTKHAFCSVHHKQRLLENQNH